MYFKLWYTTIHVNYLNPLFSANMSLRQCQQYYFGLKDEVFKGTRPYDTDRLENYLKVYYYCLQFASQFVI